MVWHLGHIDVESLGETGCKKTTKYESPKLRGLQILAAGKPKQRPVLDMHTLAQANAALNNKSVIKL